MDVVSPDLHILLRRVAMKEMIYNPSIYLRGKNKKEDIYFGEVYFIKIQDKKTNRIREVVVKKSTESPHVRINYPVGGMYVNECQFYDNIWTTLVKFQQAAHCITMIHEIPKCYGTEAGKLKEMVVLENLRFSNYQPMKSNTFLDKKHFELVFERYGKFHGLSLAYKCKFPSGFKEIQSTLYNYWAYLYKIKTFEDSIKAMLQECQQYLMLEADRNMVDKFQIYVNKGCKGFTECCLYSGEYPVILHGDSCCNNLMFRYNENMEPFDLKFIDFQIVRTGTPVFDLSYCLYSGGSKESFEHLENYLIIYYTSLKKTLENYGCDAAVVYPINVLQDEWINYCKFGFLMGLLQSKTKCIRPEEPMDILEEASDPNTSRTVSETVDTERVKQRSLDLIKHMHTCGFL